MIKITEQEFFDYMRCPAYYDMKNIRGINMELDRTYRDLLETASKFLFVNLFSGKVIGMATLKNKWDSLCEKAGDKITTKQIMEGISLLMKLYLWAEREKLVVLDIQSRYTIVLGETELTGNTGIVVSDGNRGYELIVVDFSQRMQDQTISDMKLKYTLQAYVFEKTNNKMLKGIKIHNVKHDKDILTDRGEDDYKRLQSAVKGVGDSLKNEIFYPAEGMCSTCPGKIFCRHWNR